MISVAKPSFDRITKALALAGAFVAFGCGTSERPGIDFSEDGRGRVWVHQGEAQGTTYTIKYVATDSIPQSAFDQSLEEVDVEMNAWRVESTLSQFNRFQRTDTVFAFPDMHGVWSLLWDMSDDIHRESYGAFDIAMAPMMNLWGFRTEHRDVVTPAMVDSVREFARFRTDVVDFNEVLGENDEVLTAHLSKRDPRVALDFNGIAQGFTVDGLVEVVFDHDVKDMMVELGGEVRCVGVNGNGNPWRIAIDRPQTEGRSLQAIIPVKDMAICTSGNYRKVATVNGRRVSHTIDPRTGRPVEHGLLSATIITDGAALADAYATVCMVLGPDRGAAWVDSLQTAGRAIGALFIMDDVELGYTYWATPGLLQELEWIDELPVTQQ